MICSIGGGVADMKLAAGCLQCSGLLVHFSVDLGICQSGRGSSTCRTICEKRCRSQLDVLSCPACASALHGCTADYLDGKRPSSALQLFALLAARQHCAAQLLSRDDELWQKAGRSSLGCSCAGVLECQRNLGAVQLQLGAQGAAALLPHHPLRHQHHVHSAHGCCEVLRDILALQSMTAVRQSMLSGGDGPLCMYWPVPLLIREAMQEKPCHM